MDKQNKIGATNGPYVVLFSVDFYPKSVIAHSRSWNRNQSQVDLRLQPQTRKLNSAITYEHCWNNKKNSTDKIKLVRRWQRVNKAVFANNYQTNSPALSRESRSWSAQQFAQFLSQLLYGQNFSFAVPNFSDDARQTDAALAVPWARERRLVGARKRNRTERSHDTAYSEQRTESLVSLPLRIQLGYRGYISTRVVKKGCRNGAFSLPLSFSNILRPFSKAYGFLCQLLGLAPTHALFVCIRAVHTSVHVARAVLTGGSHPFRVTCVCTRVTAENDDVIIGRRVIRAFCLPCCGWLDLWPGCGRES